MWMDLANWAILTIQKLVDSLISFLNPTWQQTVLLLVGFSLWQFKAPISKLIARIKTASTKGVDFFQEQESPKSEQGLDLLRSVPSSPIVIQNEIYIKNQLVEKGVVNPAEQNEILIRQLAFNNLVARFHDVHNSIFGSQIYLLRRMNRFRENGLSREDVESHFRKVEELHTSNFEAWDTDMYLRFLLQRNLIIAGGAGYQITEFGVEYLSWLEQQGVRDDRPL